MHDWIKGKTIGNDRGDYDQLRVGVPTPCFKGDPIEKKSCYTPGLHPLNWNASSLNGSAWVYNPVNYCPRDVYSPDRHYPLPGAGKEDVGPYLIVHPIPTDPGATVKVRGPA